MADDSWLDTTLVSEEEEGSPAVVAHGPGGMTIPVAQRLNGRQHETDILLKAYQRLRGGGSCSTASTKSDVILVHGPG